LQKVVPPLARRARLALEGFSKRVVALDQKRVALLEPGEVRDLGNAVGLPANLPAETSIALRAA
jgi:hypothetical protein